MELLINKTDFFYVKHTLNVGKIIHYIIKKR